MKTVNEKSCGVLLYKMDNGERYFLLLHYPGGHWDFPKGHVEHYDENEMSTAHRELEEETGIKNVEFIPDYREAMHYTFKRGKKERVKKMVIYFLAEAMEVDVKLSFEHKDFIWLRYNDAMEKLTFKNAKDLLKKGENHLKSFKE